MRNSGVHNTGRIGNVQDNPGDDDSDNSTFTAGMSSGGGVINTGVADNVQNQSGTGNTQNINYRRT